ncbi:probable GPI-anchored adhesin-like protein PGA55 [Penaeus japonicus]|uniref:probable GPI-anchored adhesin-like protein PGA55 n=1 Tax=Penaeus japonicus TaxID=27405 RepID=UPI001C715C90|nr:probable GPI-anchored adhesin-like protein PGA55 [Penaeus japonicus]
MTKCGIKILLLLMFAILVQAANNVSTYSDIADSTETETITTSSESSSTDETTTSNSESSSTVETITSSSESSSTVETTTSNSEPSSTDETTTSNSEPSSTVETTTSNSVSSSTFTSTDSNSGSSSTDTSTDSNTSPTEPVSSTSGASEKPLLTGKLLFQNTIEVLSNIDQTLGKFEGKVNGNLREKSNPGPLRLVWSKLNWSFIQNDVRTKAAEDQNMCQDEVDPCMAIRKLLNTIKSQTTDLADNPQSWNDDQYRQLESNSIQFDKEVEVINDNKIFNKEVTMSTIKDVKQSVDQGSQAASAEVQAYEKAETDSIVFASVFGAVGGLMGVAVVGAVIFAVVKNKKVTKKPGSKGYNHVPEERIPIGDFISGHSDPPARGVEAQRDPYARQPPPVLRRSPRTKT